MSSKKTLVLNALQVEQKINRMAYEIYENNYEEKEVIVAGIAQHGFILAKRIASVLENISPIKTKLFEISLDKDNPFNSKATSKISDKEIKDKTIILVDDVLNSGQTLIYGAKLFMNVAVKKIITVVLVDRNHTRYPVKADYVGLSLSTTLQEHISVELTGNGKDAVYLQ